MTLLRLVGEREAQVVKAPMRPTEVQKTAPGLPRRRSALAMAVSGTGLPPLGEVRIVGLAPVPVVKFSTTSSGFLVWVIATPDATLHEVGVGFLSECEGLWRP
jgi:hypothetical protein